MAKDGSGPGRPSDPEEIEILEIVGMEEGEEGKETPPRSGEEVEVVFDEGGGPAAPAPERPPSLPTEEEPVRERLLRLQADFENLRKRTVREQEDAYRHAAGNLIARLLPVLDNLERALATTRQSGGDEAFRDGVGLIYRQLIEELSREGLRPVEVAGCPFDPNVHEAMATVVTSALPPNTVVEELQRGYFFRERLLRPALVRVSVEGTGGEEPAVRREEN